MNNGEVAVPICPQCGHLTYPLKPNREVTIPISQSTLVEIAKALRDIAGDLEVLAWE